MGSQLRFSGFSKLLRVYLVPHRRYYNDSFEVLSNEFLDVIQVFAGRYAYSIVCYGMEVEQPRQLDFSLVTALR